MTRFNSPPLTRLMRQRPTSPGPSPLKGGGEHNGAISADSLSALGGGEGWGEVRGCGAKRRKAGSTKRIML